MDDEYQSFQLSQVGQPSAHDAITNIEVSIDAATKEKYIYWDDIETFFPGIKHVYRDNNIMIPFMRDTNGQRYNPTRIKHYPGTVLRVVTSTNGTPPLIENDLPPEYLARQEHEQSNHNPHLPQEYPPIVEKNIWIPPPSPSSTDFEVPKTIIENTLATPRLFIVLPLGLSDENRFQIHFLCDGGEQLSIRSPGNNTSSIIPSHIHLCGHKGYEIDRPAEFFGLYGSYALNLLFMLKYGFPVNGKAIPSLNDLEYPWLERESRDGMQFRKKMCPNIEVEVDKTIEYLISIKKGSRESFEERVKANDLDFMEGITDQTNMRSFLKDISDIETGDKERNWPLGYLYYGITDSGWKTWLCFHHHEVDFDTVALKHLRESVRWNKGVYDMQGHKLRLVLKASNTHKGASLIALLSSIKHVQELDITLDWDTSIQNLQSLQYYILGLKKLKGLRLDCGDPKRQKNGLLNRGKRADPLVPILINSSNDLEVLDLVHAEEIFAKSSTFVSISDSTITTTQLRQVHIDAFFDPKAHSEKLEIIFEKSPYLKILSLKCSKLDFCGTVELVKDLLQTHKRFQVLNLTSPNFEMTLDRSEPGSALLDPVRSELPPEPCESVVLKRYGVDLDMLLIDDNFTDEDISTLDEITQQDSLQDLKIRQIDICVDRNTFSFSKMTASGMKTLAKILHRLYAYHQQQLGPLKDLSSDLSEKVIISHSLIPPGSSLSPSSSPSSTQTDIPFKITFAAQFNFQKWRPFINETFSILTSFVLKSPDINQHSAQLGLETNHLVESHQFSVLKSFIFRGSHLQMKEESLKALIRVIKLCPLLEVFQISSLRLRNNGQWEEVLKALDYRKLKELILLKNNFGYSIQFPINVIPKDGSAVLQHLNIHGSQLSKTEKQLLFKEIWDRIPGCRVIS
ncbi:hypothetical protein BGZ49_010548 [Haplosporangium sp. Z 27]|nr:hypothetical protein BGZ49_010548 [Haplosporangium sp. Z 27]